MPRGTHHTLTGILRWTQCGYTLEINDGGVWRLDVGSGSRARRCVNQRVVIKGARVGFDLLEVERLNTA